MSGRRRSSSRADGHRGRADLVGVPARLEPDVDVQPAVAGRLRVAGDAELVEQRLELPGGRARLAKPVPGCGSRSRRSSSACSGSSARLRPDVEAEAGEVDRPRDVRDVGGDQRARRRAVDGLHGRGLEPLGRARRHALLEERRPARALREALHQHRPPAHRAHERLGDRRVVADEVELRLAALGEQDLAGARDPHLAPRELEDLRVVVGHVPTVPTARARLLVAQPGEQPQQRRPQRLELLRARERRPPLLDARGGGVRDRRDGRAPRA